MTLMVDIAKRCHGGRAFRRRDLMDETERELRRRRLWTAHADAGSSSAGKKSKGREWIDYRFLDLRKAGLLVSEARNVWRVAGAGPERDEFIPPAPIKPPQGVRYTTCQVVRIVRDYGAAKSLKRRYGYRCQVSDCGFELEAAPNRFYIEVHHVWPLGADHHGAASLDVEDNMLVLCPNHHTMFDNCIPRFIESNRIEIVGTSYELRMKHSLNSDSVRYHNQAHDRRHRHPC
jgi:putative restriction endonuclease